jgi:hypothetical protein
MGVAALAQGALAAPVIVTSWNYSVETHWNTAATVFTPISGPGAGPTSNCTAGFAPILPATGAPCPAGQDILAWGVTPDGGAAQGSTNVPGTEQSHLSILGNPAVNQAGPGAPPNPLQTTIGASPSFALGQIGKTQTFEHQNFVIDLSSFTLSTAEALGFLSLDPLVPNNPPLLGGGPFLPPLPVDIKFAETPNDGVTCANTFNGGPPAANPCPDIFVILNGINNFTFWYNGTTGALYGSDPDGADPDAVRYFVQIFPIIGNTPTVLNTLSDQECIQAGAPINCQGFITPENAITDQQFAFSITTQPVSIPEPGVLFLLALGLIGLGFTTRRRSA